MQKNCALHTHSSHTMASSVSLCLQEVPEVEGLSEEDAQAWRLQATLMARLPQVGMIQWRLRFQRLL